MFCPNCGKEIADSSAFCTFCGARIVRPGDELTDDTSSVSSVGGPGAGETWSASPVLQRPSPGVELCGDGMYRWFYELDMLKNPVILITVFKVLGLSVGIVFFIVSFFDLVNRGPSALMGIPVFVQGHIAPILLFALFFIVLVLVSYLILAAAYGGKYITLFEMNEEGVRHIQQPSQFTKAQAIAWLSAFGGIMSGDAIGGIGRGLVVGTQNTTYTTFADVRKLESKPGFHTIKLVERLTRNQIYAREEDYDFVLSYITGHIPDSARRNV